MELLAEKFPALDGQAGRMSLEDTLGVIRDWYERQPAGKRWRTPLGVFAWIARDYPRARVSYEQDLRAGRTHKARPKQERVEWE